VGGGGGGGAQTWFTIANKGSQKYLLNFLSKYVFWEQPDNHMLSINWTNTPREIRGAASCYKRLDKSKVNWILPLYKYPLMPDPGPERGQVGWSCACLFIRRRAASCLLCKVKANTAPVAAEEQISEQTWSKSDLTILNNQQAPRQVIPARAPD